MQIYPNVSCLYYLHLQKKIEYYSIDEAFLELSDNPETWYETAHLIRDTIFKHIGIPVSIGVSPTKVLSKVAASIAKKDPELNGVYLFETSQQISKKLKDLPVSKLWGIGQKSAKKLHRLGIQTAEDFRTYHNEIRIKKALTKTGGFIQKELNRIPCLSIQDILEPKKSILVSRSFSPEIKTCQRLHEALASFTSRAMEKLRIQNSVTHSVTFFTRSNRFSDALPFYASQSVYFPIPTDNTIDVLRALKSCISSLYSSHVPLKKSRALFVTLQVRGA